MTPEQTDTEAATQSADRLTAEAPVIPRQQGGGGGWLAAIVRMEQPSQGDR